MVSSQMEEYLEAIGKLEERGELVTTSALAKEIGVAPSTVTEMQRRLSDQGLVLYKPRKGVSLTAAGRDLAASVLRRHRLWERFLHDILGIAWEKAHDNACKLEHATSPDLEYQLAQALGHGTACPHGNIIPDAGGEMQPEAVVPLSELVPTQAARIVSIRRESGALLRRLEALGIRPGAVVRVEGVIPKDNLFVLSVAGRGETVEHDIASHVMVKLLSPEQSEAERIVPLTDLAPGETGLVRQFLAGRGLVARCLALGFTPGAEVKILQSFGRGPVIVLVRDTRVALGRGQAQKILVVRKENAHAETSQSKDS